MECMFVCVLACALPDVISSLTAQGPSLKTVPPSVGESSHISYDSPHRPTQGRQSLIETFSPANSRLYHVDESSYHIYLISGTLERGGREADTHKGIGDEHKVCAFPWEPENWLVVLSSLGIGDPNTPLKF